MSEKTEKTLKMMIDAVKMMTPEEFYARLKRAKEKMPDYDGEYVELVRSLLEEE